MGRRHWKGKRRVRETGVDGDSSWCCMRGALKRKILRDNRLRIELRQARKTYEQR